MVMKSFLSDWREAFVVSGGYGMGDPLAPSGVEGNREGGGITRPELLETTRPGGSESKKRLQGHCVQDHLRQVIRNAMYSFSRRTIFSKAGVEA